ncbi:asparagine synthase-related protein [Thermomonas carbonis]|uniref:asparagine synthase (glutamine-hydrolyzing) n=1 Tax=Thermomonas carbonis TaxID=1463158 RepID=A0A7G9SN59_9GAMM|nr:asparagine synthase-related protein [Thermomonas carbonis]QNN69284.1 hypothetical protein H9L16_11435 [Thermomonas carbonis]
MRLDGAPVALQDVDAVMARMAHRSPDGVACFEDGSFALAYGALHTTPESLHEHQPIVLGDRWVLAVDGRIDNREALLRQFGIDTVDAGHVADADLFAKAWVRWGGEFWRHVVGDFALAVWDRHERRLSAMRDRIGQRPLYYARSAQVLAFASEPEALLGLPGVSPVCDEDGLAYLLSSCFLSEDRGATFYRDVRRVLPGETLQASTSGLRLTRYWSIQPGPLLQLRDPREYVDAFREIFGEAVRCRLRTLHRPALMLSGGIDSASVLAAARLQHGQSGTHGLLPISLVAGAAQECEETANILHLHGQGDGIRLPVESLPGSPLFDELSSVVWEQAHPIDNSILYARLLCLVARQAGSNVVLDGADGDVVMHGENHHAADLLLAGHPLRGLREARLASHVNTYLRGLSPARILARGVAARLQPRWLAAWRHRILDRRRGEDALGPWMAPDFTRRLRLRERILEMAAEDRRRRTHCSPAENLAWTYWNPGFTRSLEGTDRTAAGLGCEARHPWCDQRVVEFFLGLPEDYKSRDGWTKWIARSAYADGLGDRVAWHSGKVHLGSRLSRQLLDASPQLVSTLLGAAKERFGGLVDPDALSDLHASWLAARDGGEAFDQDSVMQLATLAAWMARYGLHTVDA